MGDSALTIARAMVATIAALALLALGAAPARALAPANDAFADALALAGDSPEAIGTTDEATAEPGEPDRLGDMAGRSVWFRWTPSRSGLIRVTCSSTFDPVIVVYTGSALGSLTEVGSDHSGFQCAPPDLFFRARVGIEYRIAVDAREGGGAGDFSLVLENFTERPANDDFAAAQPLTGPPSFSGTTEGAGREPGEPAHAGDALGSSVWFRWTAPRSASMSVYPCDASYRPAVDVYTGASLTGLTLVSTPGDISGELFNCGLGGHGGATFAAVAGTTYSIAVDGAGREWGSFRMELRESLRDTTPPETKIDGGVYIHRRYASVDFEGTDPPAPITPQIKPPAPLAFVCRLDRRPFAPCEAPSKGYGRLAVGRHRIEVAAVDASGNVDPTPAGRSFRIKKPRKRPDRHGQGGKKKGGSRR